jgi:hypothetical protein
MVRCLRLEAINILITEHRNRPAMLFSHFSAPLFSGGEAGACQECHGRPPHPAAEPLVRKEAEGAPGQEDDEG